MKRSTTYVLALLFLISGIGQFFKTVEEYRYVPPTLPSWVPPSFSTPHYRQDHWYNVLPGSIMNLAIAIAFVVFDVRRRHRMKNADGQSIALPWRDKIELRTILYLFIAMTIAGPLLKGVAIIANGARPFSDAFWESFPTGDLIASIMSGSLITWFDRRKIKKDQTVADGLCTQCGYDLRATPDRCPECGTINNSQVTPPIL